MEVGMIGLGRMGSNMAQRLMGGGHRVVVHDTRDEAIEAAVAVGAVGASSMTALVAQLAAPRAVWIMVPAGEPTEDVVNTVASALLPGDAAIDGGNSYYRDSMRRAASLE